MSSFFFTLFHFNSLLCPERHGRRLDSPRGVSNIERKGSHIGGIGVHFGGPGHSVLGAGYSERMKDLFFVDGGELWENFCGRVR